MRTSLQLKSLRTFSLPHSVLSRFLGSQNKLMTNPSKMEPWRRERALQASGLLMYTQFSQSGFSKQEQYGRYTYLFSSEEDVQDDD